MSDGPPEPAASSAGSYAGGSPFDALASGYDSVFSASHLGRELRRVVWAELDRLVQPDSHWLDLGCGTGEDVLWLCRRGASVFGVDASSAMLAVAAGKARAAGIGAARLRLARVDLNQPGGLADSLAAGLRDAVADSLTTSRTDGMTDGRTDGAAHTAQSRVSDEQGFPGSPFDGALADFGVLNCVMDLPRLGTELGALLAPGAALLTVTMGPFCVWETGAGLAALQPKRAFRRWRSRRFSTRSGSTPLHYPWPSALAQGLAATFVPQGPPRALGLLLPPTDVAAFLRRRPAILSLLGRAEGLLRKLPGAAWGSDHYVTVFRRRADDATIPAL